MDPGYLASFNGTETYDLVLLDIEWQIALVILYSFTALLSFASNVLAIFILLKQDQFTSELWKYLVNLSVADILMALLSIPFSYTQYMLGRWIWPNWACPVVTFAQLCSVIVSVMTLTAIGLDRYFAICMPFHSIYLKRHKSQVLIVIWAVAIVLSSVMLIQTKAVPYSTGNETLYDCKEVWSDQAGKYFTVAVFAFTFGLPISALVFVYTSIGVHIIRQTAPGIPDLARDHGQWLLKIKVIKMLITIVILFVVCWLPLHVYQFVIWFYPPQITNMRIYYTVVISYFVCHWLAMAHSFLNPVIYGFHSENFKISFRKLFYRQVYQRNGSRSEAELERLSNLTNVASASNKMESSLKDINY